MYLGDRDNQRIMKWSQGVTLGILVAGGHGLRSDLKRTAWLNGVVVDQFGNEYVSEEGNHRITRWKKRATERIVIAVGKDIGDESNQLNIPC